MSEALLHARGVSIRFGGVLAVDDASIVVRRGSAHGLIGPNGAGKTTFFNVLSGLARGMSGDISFAGAPIDALPSWERARLGMARTFQNIRLFGGLTALETVMTGMHARLDQSLLAILARTPRFRRAEAQARERAEDLLAFVDLSQKALRLGGELSYGDQRRLEIARALATQPRLLLLDEPAAGMNPSEKAGLADLVRRIQESGITILVVEHDMRFIMSLCDRVTVLNFGRVIADAAPDRVRTDPAVIEAYLGHGGAQDGAAGAQERPSP